MTYMYIKDAPSTYTSMLKNEYRVIFKQRNENGKLSIKVATLNGLESQNYDSPINI